MRKRLVAAITTVTMILASAPAHAADISIDLDHLQNLTPSGDTIADLYNAARAIEVDGKSLPTIEIDHVYNAIADPATEGITDLGTKHTGKEEEIKKADEEKKRDATVGETSDGRSVIFPTSGRFSSGYGQRWGRVHQGIDIANSLGTPIYAVMDGTVTNAGPAQGFGQWVTITHANGEVSVYGHIASYSVKVGQKVKAGEKIALMGSEGRSTGPHLHFEIRPNGVNAVDPVQWFAKQGIAVEAVTS